VSTTVSRRGSLGAALAAGVLPAAARATSLGPKRLVAGTRTCEVNGRPARVFGLVGPDGRPGIRLAPDERFRVVATDGHPVHPVAGSRFPIAMGQRLDILIDLPRAGTFPILAQLEEPPCGGRSRLGRRRALPPSGRDAAGKELTSVIRFDSRHTITHQPRPSRNPAGAERQ
jgi:FtsP/CotA-like multicopper oxidase with cupredoxin domain